MNRPGEQGGRAAVRDGAWHRARLVLADDHAFILAGLRDALLQRPNIDVVATGSNGIEAIALIKTHRPDLAVFDDSMPGATGLEAFREARRWSPQTRFVILTGIAAPARMTEMKEAGIDGILLKSMSPDAIVRAIEAVLAGEQVIGEGVASMMSQVEMAETLSARERQVLEGIARGLSNGGIAETLGISSKTVDKHRSALMRKMGVNNSASLLLQAMRAGLIDP